MDPNPRLLGDTLETVVFNDDSLVSRSNNNRFIIGVRNPESPDSRELTKLDLFDYLNAYKPKLWDSLSNAAFKTIYSSRKTGQDLEYLTINLSNCESFDLTVIFEQTDIRPDSGPYTITNLYACKISCTDQVLTFKTLGSSFSVYYTNGKLQIDCSSATQGFYSVVSMEAYGSDASIGVMELDVSRSGQGTIVGTCIQSEGKLTEGSFNLENNDPTLPSLDNSLPSIVFFDKTTGRFVTSNRIETYGVLSKKYAVNVDLDSYNSSSITIDTPNLQFNGISLNNWNGDLDIIIDSSTNEISSVSMNPILIKSPRLIKVSNNTIYPITYEYYQVGGVASIVIGPGQTLYDHQLVSDRSLNLVSKNSGEYAHVKYKPLWTYMNPQDVPPGASRFYQNGIGIFLPKLNRIVHNNTELIVTEMYFGHFNTIDTVSNSLIIPIGSNRFLHSDLEKATSSGGSVTYSLLTNQTMQSFVNAYKKMEDIQSKYPSIDWNSADTFDPWNFYFEEDEGQLVDYYERIV